MEGEEQKKNKFKKIYKRIFILIYVLFLLSIILINGLSKYKMTYANQNTIQIAKIIANLVYNDSQTVNDLHNEYVDLNFTVNNYNGNKLTTTDINEVGATYKISIDKGIFTNLQYVLYSVNGQTKTPLAVTNDITNNSFSLSNQAIQEDNYCLSIKTADNIDQSSLTGNIKIEITVTQSQA